MRVDLPVAWFLAAYFTGVAAFYTVTIIRKRRRAGASPVIHGGPGTLHCRVHRTFAVFRGLIWAVAVTRLFWPGLDAWLIPLTPLWRPPVLLAGVALLIVGFAAVVAVHAYMGRDWRSGIEETGPRRLITDGPFAVSRNPTFIAIQVAQLGLFLALPTVFTLICLVVGVIAIHVQVRLEEAHLAARFGDAYGDHRTTTPRWLWPPPRRSAAPAAPRSNAKTQH